MFITIVIFFAVFFGFVSLLRFIIVAMRKQNLSESSKLLKEVFDVFKKFQYLTDITLFLGLFFSANDEKKVEEVYNKPRNLEIAQKTIVNMWSRG